MCTVDECKMAISLKQKAMSVVLLGDKIIYSDAKILQLGIWGTSIAWWLEEFQETGSVLHKKVVWGDLTLLLSREDHEEHKLFQYAWVICSPADGTPSPSYKMESWTLGFYSERLWINLFQTDELGGTDQFLGPCNPIRLFLLEKGFVKGWAILLKVGSVVELHA